LFGCHRERRMPSALLLAERRIESIDGTLCFIQDALEEGILSEPLECFREPHATGFVRIVLEGACEHRGDVGLLGEERLRKEAARQPAGAASPARGGDSPAENS